MSQLTAEPGVAVGHEETPTAVPAAPEHPPRVVRSFGMTDPGRVRTSNQDQFLIAALTKALQVYHTSLPQPKVQYGSDRGYLFVVADGMGGHAGGEHASALAIDSIENFVLGTLKWFFHLQGREGDVLLTELRQAIGQADARVIAEGSRHPELYGMGTTLTLAYSLGDQLFVVHAGDSRGYLSRGGVLYRLTHDHTMVDEMVRKGYLQPEEAAHHHLRHVITNSVGGHEQGVQVEVHKVQLQAGDCLLLCSDGLTEMVPEQEIASVLHGEADPRGACERLVARANELGGKDNITTIVARYEATA